MSKSIHVKHQFGRKLRYSVTGAPHHKTWGLYLDALRVSDRYIAPKAIELRRDAQCWQLEILSDSREWFARWLLVVRLERKRANWGMSCKRGKHGWELRFGPVKILIPSRGEYSKMNEL